MITFRIHVLVMRFVNNDYDYVLRTFTCRSRYRGVLLSNFIPVASSGTHNIDIVLLR